MSCACALGDGAYIPLGEKIKDPTIPFQQAIVRHKGGIETLVVESALEGPKSDYAWIIPVPATPTEVEAVTPGTVESMADLAIPRVSSESRIFSYVIWALTCSSVCLLSVWVFRFRLIKLLFLVLGFAFLNAIFFPVFASSGSGPNPIATNVRTFGSIGSYKVDVLRGDAAEVDTWLTKNGSRLPSQLRKVVDGYARDGWLFVAARISKGDPNISSPHPLKITFPSPECVYPMRLTAAAQKGPLVLDLYVIGAKAASVPGMEVWRSSRAVEPNKHSSLRDRYSFNVLRVGHPEIQKLLWERSFITRLHGEFQPGNLDGDLQVSFGGDHYDVKTFLTNGAANRVTVETDILAAAALFLLIALVASIDPDAMHRLLPYFFAGSLLAAAIYGQVQRSTLDIVQVEEGNTHKERIRTCETLLAIAKDIDVWPGYDLRSRWNAALKQASLSVQPREKDVPVGYTVEEFSNNVSVLTVYDQSATPHVFQFPKNVPRKQP
jgi:hypothetical protein